MIFGCSAVSSELTPDELCRRATEQRINSFPNFKAKVNEQVVHFVALFSEKEDAIPLLLLHGWPGSCYRTRRSLGAS